jgi:hypothetical protein
VAVTRAWGNTAPVESVTLPLIPPRNVCATATVGSAKLKLMVRARAQTSVFQRTINDQLARRVKMSRKYAGYAACGIGVTRMRRSSKGTAKT